MSEYQVLALFAAFLFAYSLVAARLERTPVSGAIVYVACGAAIGPHALNLIDFNINGEGIRHLAELALAVCLFTDSANADLRVLRRVEAIPVRLLFIGLPLTIIAGLGVGLAIFPDLRIVEVALIATMLAPTDAALGKSVITNPAVPAKVRESLNVESGLNDGICVPVLLCFLMLDAQSEQGTRVGSLMLTLTLQVIGIGVVVGLLLAVLGGLAIRTCFSRGWAAGTWLQIPIIALALLCFGLAQWLGGSGFIASFVGGLTLGGLAHRHKEGFLRAAEGTADALALSTWFAFGTVVTSLLSLQFNWQVVVYAVLSLTVIRMLPVGVCLIGTKLRLDTVLFVGWFGPRGLASIVFAVMVVDQGGPGNRTIVATAVWTILLSILAHGLTANGLASAYGRRVNQRDGMT